VAACVRDHHADGGAEKSRPGGSARISSTQLLVDRFRQPLLEGEAALAALVVTARVQPDRNTATALPDAGLQLNTSAGQG